MRIFGGADSTISGAAMSASRGIVGSPAIVLTIAGLDPSAGAGLLADTRIFYAHGLYGTGVITALTVQDTGGVDRVEAVGATLLEDQLNALTKDTPPAASKTGMLVSGELAGVVAGFARHGALGRLVIDPVLASTGGKPLADGHLLEVLKHELIPLCHLATPNTHEAEALTGIGIADADDAIRAATALLEMGAGSVCITGGHLSGEPVDVYMDGDGAVMLKSPRLAEGQGIHGTGCCFSAAVTARLALGEATLEAVKAAKKATEAAIEDAVSPGSGMPVPWYRA